MMISAYSILTLEALVTVSYLTDSSSIVCPAHLYVSQSIFKMIDGINEGKPFTDASKGAACQEIEYISTASTSQFSDSVKI